MILVSQVGISVDSLKNYSHYQRALSGVTRQFHAVDINHDSNIQFGWVII